MANEFKIRKGLIVEGASGGTVVDVQGSQGQLFSVTDDLSGSIFAVSDISGVPILDINSSGLSIFDGSVGIGLTSTTANLEVKSIQDSSFDEGIGVVRSNTSQTGYINMVGGAMNINAPNAIPIKFRDGGNTNLTIGGDGHATFAGTVEAATYYKSSGASAVLGTATSGEVLLRPTAWNLSTAQSSFTTTLATIGTDATFAGMITVNGGGIDIDNDDDIRLRFDNASTFKAGLQVATTAGDMIAESAIDDFAIRAQENMLFSSGGNVEVLRLDTSGNATFAGDVGLSAGKKLQYSADSFMTPENNVSGAEISTAGTFIVKTGTTPTLALTLDASQNATFAGKVGIGTTSPSTKLDVQGVVTVKGSGTGTSGSLAIQDDYDGLNHLANIGWIRSSGGVYLSYGLKQDGSADWKSTYANFSGERTYAKLDNNEFSMAHAPAQNTAVGTAVTGLTERFKFYLNTGVLQLNNYSAGILMTNSSGTVGLAGSGDLPGGPYLPLSAGSSYPLTGALNILIPGDPKLTLQSTSTDTSDWNYINFVGRDAVRDGYVGTDADGDIQVYSDKNSSSVQLTGSGIILNGGNVGIGTTSPSSLLSVGNVATYDNPSTTVNIATTDTGSYLLKVTSDQFNADGNWVGIGLGYSNNYMKMGIIAEAKDNNARGKLHFAVNTVAGSSNASISDAKMTIDNAGNVGIGTDDPDSLLHIKGADPVFIIQDTSTGTVNASSTLRLGESGAGGVLDVYWDIKQAADDLNTHLEINHSGNGNHLTILDGGNVGLGTTTPLAKLDIQGTQGQLFSVTDDLSGDIFSVADISGVPIMNVNSDGTSYFDGNVGIGTTSPLQKLSVVSDSNSQTDVSIGNTGNGVSRLYIDASNGDVSGSDYIWFGQNNDLTSEIQITQNAGSFNLKSSPGGSSQTNFTMTQAGNIGIGTTSPSTKLEVTGHVTINSPAGASQTSYGLRLRKTNSSSAVQAGGEILASVYPPNTNAANLIFKTANASANLTQRMVIDGIGNVGIGTTSPSAGRKLDVHGDIELTEDLFIGATGSSRSEHKIKIGQNRSGNGYAYIDMIGDAAATSFYNLRIIRHNSGANALSQIIHTGTGNFEIKASDGGDIILNSSGSIGISQTSPSYKLDVTGDGRFTSTVTAANFILSSDERLKENVEKVCDNKVEVDWKTFELKTEKGQKRYGVIAQELEKTNPEFVREDSQGFKSVAYIDLLIAKIAELEARLEKLEK